MLFEAGENSTSFDSKTLIKSGTEGERGRAASSNARTKDAREVKRDREGHAGTIGRPCSRPASSRRCTACNPARCLPGFAAEQDFAS